jgi:hypothetical protein
VWRRRDPEPPLTWADVQALVESLMRIESKLACIWLSPTTRTMKKRKRNNLTPDERRELRESLTDVRAELGAIRILFERRLDGLASWEAVEERRRARLRRLTFGLLGRT